MRRTAFALCIALLAALTVSAAAQTFGIGVHGSTTKSAVADERTNQWGLHARARLSTFLGVEGSLEFRSETLPNSEVVKLYPIQFSALFYIIPNRVGGIYGMLGLGWTATSYDGVLADIIGGDFTYHWGFGGELPISDMLAVLVDIRYLNLDIGISNLWAPSFDTAGWQFNYGVTVYF